MNEERTIERIEQRLIDNANDFDGIIVDMLYVIKEQAEELQEFKMMAAGNKYG